MEHIDDIEKEDNKFDLSYVLDVSKVLSDLTFKGTELIQDITYTKKSDDKSSEFPSLLESIVDFHDPSK